MSMLSAVAARVRSAELLQVVALFLGTLLFVMAVRWPGAGASNEAWFTLAPVRSTLIALTAMGLGAAEARRDRRRQRATAGAMLVLVAISEPFDVATYAASFPDVPLWWTAFAPFLAAMGYFGLGLLLGRVAAWARLRALLMLLVPGVLLASAWLDFRLGLDAFNPLTTSLHVSVAHVVAMAVLAGLAALLTRGGAGEGDPGGPAAGSAP
ncbi:MAG: hypothetical protein P8Z81_11645 [Deinococcales bacterium]